MDSYHLDLRSRLRYSLERHKLNLLAFFSAKKLMKYWPNIEHKRNCITFHLYGEPTRVVEFRGPIIHKEPYRPLITGIELISLRWDANQNGINFNRRRLPEPLLTHDNQETYDEEADAYYYRLFPENVIAGHSIFHYGRLERLCGRNVDYGEFDAKYCKLSLGYTTNGSLSTLELIAPQVYIDYTSFFIKQYS